MLMACHGNEHPGVPNWFCMTFLTVKVYFQSSADNFTLASPFIDGDSKNSGEVTALRSHHTVCSAALRNQTQDRVNSESQLCNRGHFS